MAESGVKSIKHNPVNVFRIGDRTPIHYQFVDDERIEWSYVTQVVRFNAGYMKGEDEHTKIKVSPAFLPKLVVTKEHNKFGWRTTTCSFKEETVHHWMKIQFSADVRITSLSLQFGNGLCVNECVFRTENDEEDAHELIATFQPDQTPFIQHFSFSEPIKGATFLLIMHIPAEAFRENSSCYFALYTPSD